MAQYHTTPSRWQSANALAVFAALALVSGCTDSVDGDKNTDTQPDSDSDTAASPGPDVGFDVNSSNLPEYYGFSDDGGRLSRGKTMPDDFFQLSTVEEFFIAFDATDWFDALTTATDNDEYVEATVTYHGETLESVGIQFKGNTSYRNSDERKSFAIKLDHVVDGQDIDGYNTLNFNNSMDDGSYMREVFYLNVSRRHMPVASGNFINVYINDVFWGVYPNVQQLDKDHLKQWYLSDDGTNWRADEDAAAGPPNFNSGETALNYLGDDAADYEPIYDLKSTSSESPYEHMVVATRALDGITEDNIEETSEIFDVDGALWLIAHEILFGDDDGYISKGAMDYYVHYDIVTGKLVPVEYDGNSVMNNRNAYDVFYREEDDTFPVAHKLLNIPELRQRYLAHVRTILTESFDPDVAEEMLEGYQTLIDDGVANDPHPHDGITYAGFDAAIEQVKVFIASRYDLLSSHADVSLQGPSIRDVEHLIAGDVVTSTDSPTIQAVVTHDEGVKTVYAYYGTGVVGTFTRVELLDDGSHDDGASGDGVYGNTIPSQDPGTYVRYYIEAVANDAAGGHGTSSYLPEGAEHDVFVYRVEIDVDAQSDLVINELMASNGATVADGSGEYDDWVELYNNSDEDLDLEGYHLSDDLSNLTKWTFPSLTIPAGGYLTLWLDEDQDQGDDHTNFKLSASGEDLVLSDADRTTLDFVAFGEQTQDTSYGRSPNGTGDFQLLSPSFGSENP